MTLRDLLVVVLLLSMGLATFLAEAQGPPGPKGAMPPPEVAVAIAVVRTVPLDFEYVGMTASSKTVEVRARVQGFLETRDFEEGALVTKGTRLFTIDPRSLKADRQIAVAQVEQAESRLRLAEQEVERLRSVREPGAIAASDIDQKAAEQMNASAALRLAKAQLAKADLDLSYTTVEAPLTGFVGKALKEIGSLVDSGQNSLLTVMQQVDPLYVNFKVSESEFLTHKREVESGVMSLANDAKEPYLEITLLDGATYDKRGTINFENVAVDMATGTVDLRGTFENPKNVLKAGQFVKLHLKGWERPNTLTVPQRAISQSPQGAYVYVVGSDNKVERRTVKVGAWVEHDWIVLEGLKEGEQVIVDGLTKVRPGATVVPTPASAKPELQSTPSEAPKAR